jgi:uncharacterized membrane protein
MTALDGVAERIGQASVLDAPADLIVKLLDRFIPKGPIDDVATGAVIGHPLHPALVALPIGSWVAANVLDLTGGDARTTQRLVGFGNLTAIVSAYTGASDWRRTTGAPRRIGLVHAALNDLAVGMNTASWFARRRGERAKASVLSLAATGIVSASGWLGGHLAYTLGVGVRPATSRRPTF